MIPGFEDFERRLEAPGDYHRGADELVIRDAVDKAAYGRILPLTAAARAALDEVWAAGDARTS